MEIKTNYNLIKLNTFGIPAQAKFFIELNSQSDLEELFKYSEFKNNKKLFLGGGSNILFTKDFDGIVILNKIKGIEILQEDSDDILVKSMGGVMWHELVTFVVNRGYWGIENLSLIPGTVGAAPVQNVGAYGVELKDILESVEVYEVDTGEKKFLKKDECEFGYRSSIFKGKLKGKYFIMSIVLKLSKKENKNIEYKILREYLEKNKIEVKNPKDISDAVISIRQSKLPDPALIGNVGSFFKNVYVDQNKIDELKSEYEDISFFEESEILKIPAGWLIEKCGWKGKRVGNVGVYDKQAVILVNYGGATGEEVKKLSDEIINSVKSRFGLILEREVNLI